MTTDLEIIDYDLEGAAYKNGAVVDGAFLLAKVRRRQAVVNGQVTVPQGPETVLRLPISELGGSARKALFDAFGALEQIVKDFATAHYEAELASPDGLDAKITAAAIAKREAREAAAAKEQADSELEAKRAEIARLDAELASRQPAAAEAKGP